MPDPNKAKDLLLTTDYPTDVVLLVTGSQSIPAGSTLTGNNGVYEFTISTTQDGMFFPLPCYSFNSDFTEQFFVGFGDYISPAGGSYSTQPTNDSMVVLPRGQSISGGDFQIFISTQVGTTAPARTLYYKFALMAIDNNLTIPYNSTDNIEFIFNTDNNYLKILDKQLVTNSIGVPYDVTTSLNYQPSVMAYVYTDVTDRLSFPLTTGQIVYHSMGVIKTNIVESKSRGVVSFSDMGIQFQSESGYRIYIDE